MKSNPARLPSVMCTALEVHGGAPGLQGSWTLLWFTARGARCPSLKRGHQLPCPVPLAGASVSRALKVYHQWLRGGPEVKVSGWCCKASKQLTSPASWKDVGLGGGGLPGWKGDMFLIMCPNLLPTCRYIISDAYYICPTGSQHRKKKEKNE